MASAYSVLGQSNPSAANLTDIYTVPALTETIVSSVLIANRSATATSFRLAIAVAGVADSDEQYIAYDIPIDGNDAVDYTCGLTLATTDVVRVYATLATLSFSLFGQELS